MVVVVVVANSLVVRWCRKAGGGGGEEREGSGKKNEPRETWTARTETGEFVKKEKEGKWWREKKNKGTEKKRRSITNGIRLTGTVDTKTIMSPLLKNGLFIVSWSHPKISRNAPHIVIFVFFVFVLFSFASIFLWLSDSSRKNKKNWRKKKTQNPIVVFVLYSRRDPPVVDGEHPLLRIKIHQPTHHSFTGQRNDRERVRATVNKMNLSERSHLVQWGKVMGRKWIRWLPSCRRRRHLVFGFCCLFFIFVERTSSLFIPVIPIVLACGPTQEVPPTLRHKDKWRQL